MIKLIIHILLFSYAISKELPNDVRWVRNSNEYRVICEDIFNRALKNFKSIASADTKKLKYREFTESFKNDNTLKIYEIKCSKNECFGKTKNNENNFIVKIPSLSNALISQFKKYKIDYRYVKNIDKYISKNKQHAIIVDIDETILDNSDYQVMLNETGATFSQESWSEWVNKEKAELVPGAKEFLKKIRDLNIRIIFISNRMDKNLTPTISNFKKLGIFSSDDIFLLRLNREDRKPIRRAEVFNQSGRMEKYPALKVIGFMGDAYGDFPKNDDKYIWGVNNYLFPNPMYGKW